MRHTGETTPFIGLSVDDRVQSAAGVLAEHILQGRDADPAGIADAYVQYRYLGDGGYVGGWHTAPVHDQAMGGLYGFIIDVAAEVGAELGTDDGSIQYQVYAEDTLGNLGYHPDGYVLGAPIEYCP